MEHSDFQIGTEFKTETGRWRCTDVGTRTIVAIKVDPVETATLQDGREERRLMNQQEAEIEGWFNGPPYGLAEHVFDEDDILGCEPVSEASE